MAEIWVWQGIVSPHMAALAVALARRGHTVAYLAEQVITEDRVQQGWRAPQLPGVDLVLVATPEDVASAVSRASGNSLHICEGIRSNGLIGEAQKLLRRRGLRQWALMETIDDAGLAGVAKSWVYRGLLLRRRRHLQGILTIGWRTPGWVTAHGMPAAKVFPFAYFLADNDALPALDTVRQGAYRVLYVGQLIERKCVGLLIDALGTLADEGLDVQLQVVGEGDLAPMLAEYGHKVLGERIQLHGSIPMERVQPMMQAADCLVLPSRHDGWGAVVSEALMVGTQAVVSDACGSAGVVRASGHGAVFPAGDVGALAGALRRLVKEGGAAPSRRAELAGWAQCLGAEAGAEYLERILQRPAGDTEIPAAPWASTLNAERTACAA